MQAATAHVAGQLGVGERTEVALHGDVQGRRGLPLQHTAGKSALDCHCSQPIALQFRQEICSIGAEKCLAARREVSGTGRCLVCRV